MAITSPFRQIAIHLCAMGLCRTTASTTTGRVPGFQRFPPPVLIVQARHGHLQAGHVHSILSGLLLCSSPALSRRSDGLYLLHQLSFFIAMLTIPSISQPWMTAGRPIQRQCPWERKTRGCQASPCFFVRPFHLLFMQG